MCCCATLEWCLEETQTQNQCHALTCKCVSICVILTPTVLGASEDDWQSWEKRDTVDAVGVALQCMDAGFVLAAKEGHD